MDMLYRAIKKSVLVNADVEKVFSLWTSEEGVKQFFATEANIEYKVGGIYEIYFDPNAAVGFKGSEGARIVDISPNQSITFTWNAPPSLNHHRSKQFFSKVQINFTTEGSQTKVTLQNDGYPVDSYYDDVFQYFDRAWGYVLGELQKLFV